MSRIASCGARTTNHWWGLIALRGLSFGPLALCAVALLCTALKPSVAAAYQRRVLVAIAQNEGLPGEVPLRFAHRDAERMVEVFRELGGVSPRDAHILKEATVGGVLAKLSQIATETDEDTGLIVFYSGHGSDGSLHLAGEKLPLTKLQGAIERIPARLRMTFVDACRGAERTKGFERTLPFHVTGLDSRHEGDVVIHAASPGELTLESDRWEAGVFTHFLVSALRGGGDNDNDGHVSLQEAYEFAYSRTRDSMLEREVPAPTGPYIDFVLRGSGPVLLTTVARAQSALLLPAEPEETRYLVVAKGSGAMVAQVWGEPSGSTEVGLPRGQFIVHRISSEEHGRKEVVLRSGARLPLGQADFVPVTGGDRAAAKGSYDLARRVQPGDSPHPHRVGVSLGVLVDQSESERSTGALAPAVSVSYAYGTAGWGPFASLSAWRRAFPFTEDTLLKRDIVALSGGAMHQWVLPSWVLRAGLGLTVQGVHQTDFDSGKQRGSSDTGLRAGPQVNLGASFPLTGELTSDIGISGIMVLYEPDEFQRKLVGEWAGEAALLLHWGVTVGL